MNKKICKYSVFILLFYIFFPSLTQAAEKGLIIADQFVGDYENETFVAKGNVTVTYKDYVITGEEIFIDLTTDLLSSQQVVEVKDQERTVKGKNFHLYLREEQGGIEDFFYVEQSEDTGEPLIFKGKTAEIDGEELRCHESSFTGCNLENPHYHLTAERMEYYPGDRLEFYWVSYWEGKIRLLVLPKIVFPLREEENDFDESTFGYNYTDGFFLKMVYRYALSNNHQGKLLFDLIQAKGVGEGIKHNFQVGTGKKLEVSLYHLDNRLTTHHDYQVITNWNQEIGALNYSVGGNYNDLGYPEYRFKGNIYYKSKDWPTSGRIELGRRGLIPEFYIYPCNLNLSWRPNRRSQLNYKTSYYYRQDLSTLIIKDQRYQNDLNFRQTWDLFSLKNFQLQVKVKQEYRYSDRYQIPYYHELPAVGLQTPDLNLGFPGYYRTNLDFLRLVEIRGDQEKEGYRTELLIQRRPLGRRLWQVGGFTLDLANTYRFQHYQIDEGVFERKAMMIGLTGTEKFTPRFTWTNTVSWVETEGAAPVLEFPRLVQNSYQFLPGGNIASRLQYNSKILTSNLSSGYNLSGVENPWHPLQFTAALNINSDNTLRFNASYNPNLQQYNYLYLIAKCKYQSSKGNNFYLDLYYDFLTRRWTRLETEAQLKQNLTKNLQADLDIKYSFFGDGLEKTRLGLNYNWHCRELFFGYDLMRKEYLFQFSYKVFKEAGFGYGTGQQGFIWTGADVWGNQGGTW